MSNEAVAGYIVVKTLQQKPLRYFDGNYNEFKDKNMLLFIQKKYGDMKKRIGETELPLKTFTNTQLHIKPKANDRIKIIQANYELDDKVLDIMQNRLDKEQIESLLQEPQPLSKNKLWKKRPITVQQKLSVLMNDNIEQANLEELYQQYQRQNLKSSINELKTQFKDPKVIFKKLGAQNNEFDDQEQVNFFMKKLCENKQLTACSVLELNNVDINYKEDTTDEKERWKNIMEKRITQEQMQKLIEEEELRQNKQLIQIFKDTRIDQFDPDFFKKKVKSKTMKKVNEIQDKQYHQFFVSSDTPTSHLQKEDFLRKRYNYSSLKLNRVESLSKFSKTTRPTTSRPTTSKSGYIKIKNNQDVEFNRLIKQCDVVESTFQTSNGKITDRINQLDSMMDKACLYLSQDKQEVEREPNQEFEKFKSQRVFKKKFVSYLIEKVEKQSDLLSKKIITDRSKKMINKVLSNLQ